MGNRTVRLHNSCVDLDRDHSARRIYLNSRFAHDRLIVSNSFWFFPLSPVSFRSVWFKLKTMWSHHCNATINCWLIPPQNNNNNNKRLFPAKSTKNVACTWIIDLLLCNKSVKRRHFVVEFAARTVCNRLWAVRCLPCAWHSDLLLWS